MASHHFIGSGRLAPESAVHGQDATGLLREIGDLVAASGLQVMEGSKVEFENGGATLIWVLAESHLVVHLWRPEGFATVDLHVCDYRSDNAPKAADLRRRIEEYCFVAGSGSWQELSLPTPDEPA